MKKKALITGITGQIGSYLAELLAEKGYEVYGIVRGKIDRKQEAIERINGYSIFEGDLEHPVSIERVIRKVEPDEIYNFAAQSDAIISSNLPGYTFRINAEAVLAVCEILRKTNKPAKFFQASSAELFKGFEGGKVNENTPFIPSNPYGIAKLAAYWGVRHYRERYGIYACNGLFFNSESPRRGENFVTRKITKGIADIMKGKQETLRIGSLDAKRDWSHAKDTAAAAWNILQAEKPDDYVVASGDLHSVREFVETAFRHAGVNLMWKGEGLDEVGHDKDGRVYVTVDSTYFRPHESKNFMVGDTTKLKAKTEWKPSYNFEALVKEMITKELAQN